MDTSDPDPGDQDNPILNYGPSPSFHDSDGDGVINSCDTSAWDALDDANYCDPDPDPDPEPEPQPTMGQLVNDFRVVVIVLLGFLTGIQFYMATWPRFRGS